MSKKLEKLREVNMQLKSILSELETKMFIENINDTKSKMAKEEQPKVVMQIK